MQYRYYNDAYAIIAGYASTFNNIDKSNHVVLPTALSTKDFTKGIPILFQHNFNKPLGALLHAKADSKGLYVEAAIMLNTQLQQNVFNSIRDNKVRGMSVGLKIESSKMEMGVLNIKKAKLLEISLTSNPVNSFCHIDFCEEF